MIAFLKRQLAWWAAPQEMAELERWRIHCTDYWRWLAEFPDVAVTLENLREQASGRPVNISRPRHPHMPWDVVNLRDELRERARKAKQE